MPWCTSSFLFERRFGPINKMWVAPKKEFARLLRPSDFKQYLIFVTNFSKELPVSSFIGTLSEIH